MENITLKFTLESTDYSVPLGMRVRLDNNVIYESNHVTSEQIVEHSLSDADAEHELTFELFGKKSEHTKINEAGEIVSDAMLSIKNLEIDEIEIDQLIKNIAVYQHDFNGTQAPTEVKFYSHLGCNGTVRLKFSTPVYLWLLENM